MPAEYCAKAAADGRNRLIDACGLHDPKAAAEATGDVGDEILPSTSGLQECILRVHQNDKPDAQTWTFYLEVGAMYDAASRKDAAPENLGAVDVFVEEDEKRCTVSKPIDDNYAIQLRASAYSDTPTKPACQVLRQYVHQVGAVVEGDAQARQRPHGARAHVGQGGSVHGGVGHLGTTPRWTRTTAPIARSAPTT